MPTTQSSKAGEAKVRALVYRNMNYIFRPAFGGISMQGMQTDDPTARDTHMHFSDPAKAEQEIQRMMAKGATRSESLESFYK